MSVKKYNRGIAKLELLKVSLNLMIKIILLAKHELVIHKKAFKPISETLTMDAYNFYRYIFIANKFYNLLDNDIQNKIRIECITLAKRHLYLLESDINFNMHYFGNSINYNIYNLIFELIEKCEKLLNGYEKIKVNKI